MDIYCNACTNHKPSHNLINCQIFYNIDYYVSLFRTIAFTRQPYLYVETHPPIIWMGKNEYGRVEIWWMGKNMKEQKKVFQNHRYC